MIVARDDLWLCVDCLMVAVNGDATSIDEGSKDATDRKIAEIEAGLDGLGPHLVPDFDSETGEGHEEFAHMGCDCCGSDLAGEMHRFAILGEPPDPESKPPTSGPDPPNMGFGRDDGE